MSPWEVIQEALAHRKPVRNLQWLADQIGASIQVVVNWKTRGVPAKRYRDIASALGISLDQLEGIEPLPWVRAAETTQTAFSDDVFTLATDIELLPNRQRDWVLMTVRQAIELARETVPTNGAVAQKPKEVTQTQPKRVRHN